MNRRWPLLVLALAALGLWATTPSRLEFDPGATLPDLGSPGLIPGTEERVVERADGASDEWVVIALHGFSATRQETAPLAESVAASLDASLIEARLTGHGHSVDPLHGVTAEHWLADAQRIMTTAAALGEKLVVIGTSTGATLAAAVLDQAFADRIDTLVMISPNFEPRDWRAKWLTRPAGPLLARLLVGDTRCWEPRNELQARFWSTCYPMAATIEVMRLVDRANRLLPGAINQRLLMFYSRNDEVVSPDAAMTVYQATEAPAKQAIEVSNAGDASHHVLAGDIMSPGTTDEVAAAIVEFIRRPTR